MTDHVQTVVVGAGVIGIAVARKLARLGHEVLILEAEERVAQHTSSRNSGVIHAGLYYDPNSLRAKLCVQGKGMLYDYCLSRHVPHEKTGKLVVATTPEQLNQQTALIENARANGVDDLKIISAAEAIAMEPELACLGAIHSPSTGIVDAPALIQSLLGEAEAAGAMLALGSSLSRVVPVVDGYQLDVGEVQLTCQNLINAAGLGAWDIAQAFEGYPAALIPPKYFAKGRWYATGGKLPFKQLIYPMSDGHSLGVHFTRDLGGGFRFGPDLEYLDPAVVNYDMGESRAQAFEVSVARWWPNVPKGAMQPEGCGIRPRVTQLGTAQSDYHFAGQAEHGYKGLVHLFGMESPGLTSCLAIGDYVAKMIEGTKQ